MWILPLILLFAVGAGGATAQEIPAEAPVFEQLAAAQEAYQVALGSLNSGLAADTRHAQSLLESALATVRRAGVADAEANILYALGLAHAQMRRWSSPEEIAAHTEQALAYYRQAVDLQRSLGDHQGEAATLNNLGLIFAETGRPIEAFAHLEAALPLRRAVGDLRGEAATAHNLAALHVQLGEIQAGLDHYRRALALHRQLDEPSAEASTLNNLGLVFARLGEHEKADVHLRQALALHRASGNIRDEAGTLGNLGLASFELDSFALALGQLTTARDLYRGLGDQAGVGDMLNNLGLVHLEAEQLEPAGKAFAEALEIQHLLGDRRAQAAVLSNLGQLHRQRRQFKPARAHLERALGMQRQARDTWGTSFTLLELARLAADRGQLSSALTTIEEAIGIVESLRAGILDPGYRASLLGERRELYEFRVDVLTQLDHKHPGAGHGAAALVAAESARARGLLDSLGEARAGIRRAVDPELLKVQRGLERRLSAQESVRRRLQQQGDASGTEAIEGEIEALLDDYRRLEEQIRARDPRYADLVRPEPLTPAAMRRLVDENTVILEYSLGEERSVLWTVTSKAVTGHVLAGRERIEAAARGLHERLERSRERAFQGPARVAAAELAELILRPARAALDHRRIVVVADGALEYVPFGILPSDGSTGRPLGLDHEVLALPSIAVLASLRDGDGTTAQKTIAILADPVFDPGDPRLAGVPPGRVESTDVQVLPRLAHSRREAEVVAAMVPAEQRLLALDFAAHRELLTEGALEPFRIVHIATHGVLDTQRPELSALVLSQFDAEGGTRAGHLRLLDIYNLRLRADLVVLSACRTALGHEIRGEGLISLARGFLYAGARQVLVSLWQVDDEATAVLMERFYRGLLVEGLPAAAALRVAQSQVSSDNRWQAPYFWSGFVLQGDWR